MSKLSRTEAHNILQRCRVPLSVDFHALDTSQVSALIAEADAVKYRKPTNANGSRARYFHAYVVRVATRSA